MEMALFILVTLNIASFAWSVFGVFNSTPQRQNIKYLVLVVVSLLTYVTTMVEVFLHVQENVYLQIIAIVLTSLSLILFWLSYKATKENKLSLVYSKDLPQHIVKNGPYAYVRNPFYLAYLFCYMGALLATQSIYLLICFTAMAIIYYEATLQEEKKFLSSEIADEYLKYKSSTGRFLPKFKF